MHTEHINNETLHMYKYRERGEVERCKLPAFRGKCRREIEP